MNRKAQCIGKFIAKAGILYIAFLASAFPAVAGPVQPDVTAASDPAAAIGAAINAFATSNNLIGIARLAPYGDHVLDYLPKYLASPDTRVFEAAEMIASLAKTDEVIRLLGPYMRSPEGDMADFMFFCYGPSSVRSSGGSTVRNNMMWRVLHDSEAGANCLYPLLLASYRSDPMVITFLQGLERREIAAPEKIVSMPATLRDGEVSPPIEIPKLGSSCHGFRMSGAFVVPYEFTLHLALAQLHQKADEEAVLWRLQDSDLPSIVYSLSCARYITNKPLLLALVELVNNHTDTKILKPYTLYDGPPITDADYIRVCDYAVGMLACTLQVDVGIPDLAKVDLMPAVHGYRKIDFDSIGNVRRFDEDELATAYARLKAAVDKLPDN